MAPKLPVLYRILTSFIRSVLYPAMGGIFPRHLDRVPMEGAVILAPVHLSHLDPPLVGVTVRRFIRTVAKKELFFFPLGFLIRCVGGFPISRQSFDRAAVRQSEQILKEGGVLTLFPEGTRGDGVRMGEFKTGLFHLAQKSDALIVPVGINGTQTALPRGAKWPKRTPMHLAFGPPFRISELSRLRPGVKPKPAFTLELEQRIKAACQELGLPIKTFSEE